MPRRAHVNRRSAYFHVTNRSANGLVLFAHPADYRAFLAILCQGLDEYPTRLIAFTLMPTHWHLVMGPTDTETLSRCVHWVTATHAALLHRHHVPPVEGPVYRGSFNALEIPAAGHLMHVCRLVERAALEAGLVRRAQDWPWASLSERLHPACDLPLVNAPFLSSRSWADFVNVARPDDPRGIGHLSGSDLRDVAQPPGGFA